MRKTLCEQVEERFNKTSEELNNYDSPNQEKLSQRFKSEWEKIAKEKIDVQNISGTFYAYGSELAILRLLAYFVKKTNFKFGDNFDIGVSASNKHYFMFDK